MSSTARGTAVAVALTVVALAGCGSESEDGVASLDGNGAPSAVADADVQRDTVAWFECMTDEGVAVGEPIFTEDGELDLDALIAAERAAEATSDTTGGDPEAEMESYLVALDACGELPPEVFGLDEDDVSQLQDAALEFSRCLQDKGYDVPDIDLNVDPTTDPLADLDAEDPQVAADIEECSEVYDGTAVGDAATAGD